MRRTIAQIIHIVDGEWLGDADALQSVVTSVSTDSREVMERSIFIPIVGEHFDGHRFATDALQKGSVFTLWQRGHSLEPPTGALVMLVEDTVKALQQLASHYLRQVGCRVVAITGSNGKTTTKDIVAGLLQTKYRTHANVGNLNNEIGLPLTILAMPEDTEIAVLEMGMNHFGEIETLSRIAPPDYAVITNIGDAHIEHLGSREGIARAKLEIVAGMEGRGTLFYPGDEPLLSNSPEFGAYDGRKVSCGTSAGNEQALAIIDDLGFDGLVVEDEETKERYTVPIPGAHNASNAAFALGVAKALQLTPDQIRAGFAQVTISKMRMELRKGKNGVTIINDAYNASLLSMRAALSFLASLADWERKIVVLGDIGELGEQGPAIHHELGRLLDPVQFPIVYVVGPLSKHIVEGARVAGYTHVQHMETKEAVSTALQAYLDERTIILVKASRFMGMESIVQSLLT